MTRKDIIQILAVLRAAYPLFYRNVNKDDANAVVNLWLDLFSDDDPVLVGASVKAIIATTDGSYPPTIGAIKEKMRQLAKPDEMSEADAWNAIAKAVKNSAYGSAEEYEKLPPVLQTLVGSPAQLRDWALMDSNAVHSVVASNIQRAYRTVSMRCNDMAKLPPDLRSIIGDVVNKLND